jgi:hypothetical protein
MYPSSPGPASDADRATPHFLDEREYSAIKRVFYPDDDGFCVAQGYNPEEQVFCISHFDQISGH